MAGKSAHTIYQKVSDIYQLLSTCNMVSAYYLLSTYLLLVQFDKDMQTNMKLKHETDKAMHEKKCYRFVNVLDTKFYIVQSQRYVAIYVANNHQAK